MGQCVSSKSLQTQKELHALKELQASTKAATDELNRVKSTNGEKVGKMQTEHQAEVRELQEKISRMIETTSVENQKMQEQHVEEMRSMHERHTKEVRRIQEDHHSHMSQELIRHVDEVRKLQVEYRNQLRGLGVDMRYISGGNRLCCGPSAYAPPKEVIAFENTSVPQYGKMV